MKRHFFYGLLLWMLGTASSCRDFVEFEPVQVKALRTTEQYQQLLYNRTNMEGAFGLPTPAGDDVYSPDDITWQNGQSVTNLNAYVWAESFVGADEEDFDWSAQYKQIYWSNLVINGVLNSEEGTNDQKRKVWASALVFRADNFLNLVNMYARQYNPTTAEQEAGIPLQINTSFTGSLQRASVARVYQQVLDDLNSSLPYLPTQPDVVSNPSKLAAYALLARTHLNMRNFDKAYMYADSALALRNTLLDLNAYVSASSLIGKLKDPEVMFLRKSTATMFAIPVSPELIALMGTEDLRYSIFTASTSGVYGFSIPTNRAYFRGRRTTDGGQVQVGPTVPEMMLIKAEVEARRGNSTNALALINQLRMKRFSPQQYQPLTVASGSAIDLVIKERRIEFMCTGIRWFDMKRYDIDGLTPVVSKQLRGSTYTLNPGSNRYLFPIAPKYIALNPEISQNPR